MEAKFYKCPICGNVFAVIEDSGVVPVCCGKPMLHLNAMQTDGAAEKHVPVVTRQEDGKLKTHKTRSKPTRKDLTTPNSLPTKSKYR